MTIQPILVSNDNGSNSAEFFGSSTQESEIKQLIDGIYLQAGIDVRWLAETRWNNTFANVGNGGTRPGWHLDAVTSDGESAGVASSNPRVINMYFVEVSAGFGDTGENYANGLAFVDFNGITMHVGDRMVSSEGRRGVVAKVAAHEIAHNLGLDHVSDPSNLMAEGQGLVAEQVFRIRNSFFAVPV